MNESARSWAAWRGFVVVLAATLAIGGAAFVPGEAIGAQPPLLREFCPTGSVGGQCRNPRGIGVDPVSGHAYVADLGNKRIDKFTPWGEFERAWGRDVVASGPGDKGSGFEVCVPAEGDVCKAGVAGSAAGEFGGIAGGGFTPTSPVGVAVDAAGDVYVVDLTNLRVQKFSPEGEFLLAWGGDVIVDGAAGTGSVTNGSATITSVVTTEKDFRVGQAIEGTGIEPGTTIAALGAGTITLPGAGTITLSQPAGPAASGTTTALTVASGANNVAANEKQAVKLGANTTGGKFALTFTTPNPSPSSAFTGARGEGKLAANSTLVTEVSIKSGTFAVGDPIFGSGIKEGTMIAAVGAGTITLSQETGSSVPAGKTELTTASLPYNASAGEVQAALAALPNIGAGNVEVTGSAGGPWTVEFKGSRFADTNVSRMSADVRGLTVSSGAKEVNVTSANVGEICSVAAECQEGAEGGVKGQFGLLKVGDAIDAAPDGEAIFVGEAGRIQEFDTAGHQSGEVALPEEPEEETAQSLAVDPAGNFYYTKSRSGGVGQATKPDVFKLGPAGEALCTIEAGEPQALASGPKGEVYVVDAGPPREISRYNSSCGGKTVLFGPEPPGKEFSTSPTGIEASSACREEGEDGVDLLISNPEESNSFVKLFGPPPNANLCPPPPKPPLIEAQFASSVGSDGATVRAKINPRFWPDTAYYVQYGTAACLAAEDWEAACVKDQPAPPGIDLTDATINSALNSKGVFLGASEPLLPDTTYRYRFVAESGFSLPDSNGPVYGKGGGEEAEPGVYVIEGKSSAFHTAPVPSAGKIDCANQPFRTGPSAPLPDCRAYEVVSPLDKNNGDIASWRDSALGQAAGDGEAISFAAWTAFAEPQGAPLYNQYLSQREPGGWSAGSINAPRRSVGLVFGENLNTRFKAFDEGLCSGWLLQDTDVPLVEGLVPRGVINFYRHRGLREDCGGPGGYELLSTVFPPGYEPAVEKSQGGYYPQIQGFSADGQSSAFRAAAALSADACQVPTKAGPNGKGIFQVYLSREGTPGVPPVLVSALPDDEAACTHSSVGTSQSFFGGFNTREDSLHNAVSEDASRIYWMATQNAAPTGHSNPQGGAEPGELYLRLNPTEPQSAFEHGRARGKGDLVGPVSATGTTTKFSKTVSKVRVSSGEFTVGQTITGPGIAAESKITKIEEEEVKKEEEEEEEKSGPRFKLTLDKAATAGNGKEKVELTGHPSNLLTNVSTASGEFEVGQRLSGEGIAPGTTIVGLNPPGTPTELTLSAPATATKSQSALIATSKCTEPSAACTLPVSEEAEGLSEATASRFLDAAKDGSAAIFLSGEDLYEFDLAKALAGEAASTLIAHQVRGIMGASEDAARVYLVSAEELEGEGEAGEPNLYLHERGVGFEFIATLGGPGDTLAGDNSTPTSSIARYASKRVSRVSPDGASAAFTSADPALAEAVAGYDNTDVKSGKADREIYLYDATANGGEGSLICASCNPSGARPAGRLIEKPNVNPAEDIWAAARLPGWITSLHPGNLLSPDGRRLFFESFEALVPRDTNGMGDVYEWERAKDEDQCRKEIGGELFLAATGGCLSLISSAQGGADALLIDASADGRDVFFVTNARLVGQDTDQLQDLYDARVGGGFPPPPVPVPPCEGDACRSPASPPDDPTPASEAPSRGSANLPAPPKARCAKGKRPTVRKGKTRCLPKRRQERRQRRAAR